MPNRNSNSVSIHAPYEAVKTWLIAFDDGSYHFNMHKLFPEHVPASDPRWYNLLDCDTLTGTKWIVNVEFCDGDEATTSLGYDSARTPNFGTLQRLHELTGWAIENEYEEPGVGFEGTFCCEGGTCSNDEREYRPLCEVCDEKKAASEFDNNYEDGTVCNDCLTSRSTS